MQRSTILITADNLTNRQTQLLHSPYSNIISTILITVYIYIYLLNSALEHVCLCIERLINVVKINK